MLRIYLHVTFWVNAVLLSTISVLLLVRWHNPNLERFLADTQRCAATCLLDIRPLETKVGEAMTILDAHPWVQEVKLSAPGTGYGQIRWLWSGQQPEWIENSHQGRITFYWNATEQNAPNLYDSKVETISVYTQLRLFDLQSWYGQPDSGIASLRPDQTVGYSVAYQHPGGAISLSAVIACPASPHDFWNAPARIGLSTLHDTGKYIPFLDLRRLC